MHGPVLWTNPVTINNPICVPHYYWGAGRPEWVSGSIPTTVPCPPSGRQFRLHVGYRSTLIQSLNQCRIDLWLYDTFLHNRIYIFILSCYSNTQNSSLETQEYNRFLSHLSHISTREVHAPQYYNYAQNPIYITGLIMTNYTSPVYIDLGLFSWFRLW